MKLNKIYSTIIINLKKTCSTPFIWVSFIVLLSISIISLILSLKIETHYSWWSGFLAGLSTEILGILLTLLFVDLILRTREENRRRKIELIALSQIREALYSHIHFLAMLANDSGKDKWIVVNTVFDDEFFEKISDFDITKPSNSYHKAPWYDLIPRRFENFECRLSKVIDKYTFFLHEDTLELLNKLQCPTDKSFMFILRPLYTTAKKLGFDTAKPFKGGILNGLRKYTQLLLKMVEHHNTLVSSVDRIEKIQVGSITGEQIYF